MSGIDSFRLMPLPLSRTVAILAATVIAGALAIALPTAAQAEEPTPAWTNVHINEVSSDNGATPVGDAIELYNSGAADVSIAGWLQIDSGAATAATGVLREARGRHRDDRRSRRTATCTSASTKGLGSGGDGVKLYLPDGANGTAGTLVDSVVYTAGEAGTDESNNFGAGAFARCPDGSGAFVSVAAKSFGASNATACLTPLTNPADNPVPTLPVPARGRIRHGHSSRHRAHPDHVAGQPQPSPSPTRSARGRRRPARRAATSAA